MKKPAFGMKGYKHWVANEGDGFQYTLLIDGKPVAFVNYDGWGGPVDITWHDKAAERRVEEYVQTLPPTPVPFTNCETVETTLEIWLEEEMNRALNDATFKRQCKTKTLYRLKDDPEGQYWTMKSPYSARVREHLRQKYGDKLVEIINERFLQSK